MSLVYRSDAASKGRRNSIFIGGKVDAKNKEWLRQSGIDYILNVTPPKEAGIKVCRVMCLSFLIYDVSTIIIARSSRSFMTITSTSLFYIHTIIS
jgi:hypothetical protein